MTTVDFIKGTRAIDGAVKALPFVILADGRKVQYTVDAPNTLDSGDVAAAIKKSGAKGKLASNAAKGASRGIGGSFEYPAGEKAAMEFLHVWDSAAVEVDETVEV